ncbi:hypothetical protein ACIQZB_29115 [Streptomyces sp. NPDC097727]|uniref:hypothetical protein n=1 Tax=Streptomyces sp. NPDC097727 TaxID=3366092 RepID=UPI0038233519
MSSSRAVRSHFTVGLAARGRQRAAGTEFGVGEVELGVVPDGPSVTDRGGGHAQV